MSSLDLDQDLLSPSVQSPEESVESADSQVCPKPSAGCWWVKSWLPLSGTTARASGHRNQRACSALWSASVSLKSAVGTGLHAHCCPGPACVSLECPSAPQLWAAPCPGTAQGDMLALQPGGLHALHLCRAPLPHVLGTAGALWVRVGISALQGVPACSSYHPHPAGAWKEFWQPWGFLAATQARRRSLVCPCLLALPFFLPCAEAALRTAGEEEEVQRGPGFQGRG